MRYLTQSAASYVGVDLHARTLFVCVLDQVGTVRLSRNLPAKPQPFLDALPLPRLRRLGPGTTPRCV